MRRSLVKIDFPLCRVESWALADSVIKIGTLTSIPENVGYRKFWSFPYCSTSACMGKFSGSPTSVPATDSIRDSTAGPGLLSLSPEPQGTAAGDGVASLQREASPLAFSTGVSEQKHILGFTCSFLDLGIQLCHKLTPLRQDMNTEGLSHRGDTWYGYKTLSD